MAKNFLGLKNAEKIHHQVSQAVVQRKRKGFSSQETSTKKVGSQNKNQNTVKQRGGDVVRIFEE